ncbi:MAG: T9SS type A sorting domain-containing protein [Saprospiraceae bacterium]|nr:T9SS type A sorting domain-containing protein [Saprospiraceae bacterium]
MPGIETARAVQQISSGHFVLTGDVRANTTAERQVLMIKTWPDGSIQWQSEFGGVLGDGGNAIRIAPNNGFVMAGFTASFGAGASDGYLLRTDATGISLSNFILGNVHSNLNNTCLPYNFGTNIPNYLVEIAGNKTYFGTTDANGNYFVPVEAGDYNVRLLNPSPIWLTCQDSVDITLTGVFDTATVDFSIYSQDPCPAMEVDLTTLGLRRCFQNVYSVNYRNLGSEAANPALVEVTFDPWLTVDSTSIPWVSNVGNTYTFDVGTVAPFAEGDFQAWVTVDCDSTVLGQTHCSEAHIFPNTFCFDPDPSWDGASVQLEATCTEDSVVFKVKNLGIGDMVEPQGFIVIEDQILQMQGEFQLGFGTDTLIALPANGSTFRMEADQSPGHPGNSQPCISVEGCGANPFSTGFVVDYPLNDADLFVDTDCRENIGSFDPNDKQGFPVGYGNLHFIEPGTDIEYLIRFQNTGTDTAFTVTVRDTLSLFLDPTSIEPGAASHPYRYELYGSGILKFTFDDIMLPDSNVNEPHSHGFVKFRAKQRQTNTPGMVIKNRAGIYFDFNTPVITNTVFHTLAENFILIDSVSSVQPGTAPQPGVRVYPNPFDETALFELENVQANHLVFSLFDMNGRQVRQQFFDKNKFQFQRDGLPSGVYFFQIAAPDRTVARGKVVLR